MNRWRKVDSVICESSKIAQLSDGAENLYYRLLVNADDYGRFYSKAETVLGICYHNNDKKKKTPQEIETYLQELNKVRGDSKDKDFGLIRFYQANQIRYLEITQFENHQNLNPTYRKKKEYPDPENSQPVNLLEEINKIADTNLRTFLAALSQTKVQNKPYRFTTIEKETEVFNLFQAVGNPLEMLKDYETWANETKTKIKNIRSSVRNCAKWDKWKKEEPGKSDFKKPTQRSWEPEGWEKKVQFRKPLEEKKNADATAEPKTGTENNTGAD